MTGLANVTNHNFLRDNPNYVVNEDICKDCKPSSLYSLWLNISYMHYLVNTIKDVSPDFFDTIELKAVPRPDYFNWCQGLVGEAMIICLENCFLDKIALQYCVLYAEAKLEVEHELAERPIVIIRNS